MLYPLLALISFAIAAASGFVFYRFFTDLRSKALAASILAPALIGAFLLTNLGLNLVQQAQLSFNEFYNGVETGVQMIPTACYEDGVCNWTRACDYYLYTYYTYDSNGNAHLHTEWRHHECPYATEEDRWLIHSTIGDIPVADHVFPAHYTLYDASVPIPGYLLQEAGIGEPKEAALAEQAIAAGNPRPATLVEPYSDYYKDYLDNSGTPQLLQAQDTDIKQYQKWLPAITTSTYDLDQANKMYLVGLGDANAAAWENAVAHLDMEAGLIEPLTARFDIQIVAVSSSLVPAGDAENYTLALQAYWEGRSFGQAALPKNMAVVVMGTDGETVQWARGFTLLPEGNGETWTALELDLPGASFTPQALIGSPRVVLHGQRIATIIRGNGLLEQILITGPFHFVRPHETNKHAGSTGYEWLVQGIAPTFWQDVLIVLCVAFLTTILTLICFRLMVFIIDD